MYMLAQPHFRFVFFLIVLPQIFFILSMLTCVCARVCVYVCLCFTNMNFISVLHCHTCECVMCFNFIFVLHTYVCPSCVCVCVRVCVYVCMSHVAHMNDSCRTREWVMSHISMSCVADQWFMSHISMSRVYTSCRTKESVPSHISMRHVAHINESCRTYCRTYPWVTEQI